MIILMRHARTVGGEGRYIGRTALTLSEKGRQQAAQLSESLGSTPLVTLWSSPAKRCQETAGYFAKRLGLKVRCLAELDEIDLGTWDGLRFEEVRAADPQGYAERGSSFATFRPPNGECFNDVADRALKALHILAAQPDPVLAVTHAGVIRSLLCRLTGHPVSDLFHFSPKHLECAIVRPTTEGFRVTATDLTLRDVLLRIKVSTFVAHSSEP